VRDAGRGFTLVELAAVLVLLAVIGGTAALSLRGLGQVARTEDVVERLAAWDRQCRLLAMQSGQPVRMTVDLEDATLTRAWQSDRGDREPSGWALPRGYRLEALEQETRIAGSGVDDRRVTFSPAGHSPSYALGFTDPRGRRGWFFVAGLSGQWKVWDDKQPIDAILDELAAAGANAD